MIDSRIFSKSISLIALSICCHAAGQHLVSKKMSVSKISLIYPDTNPNDDSTLKKIVLIKENDSVACVKKIYSARDLVDPCSDRKITRFMFDQILTEFSKIDFRKIDQIKTSGKNIYSLKLADKDSELGIEVESPEKNTQQRGLQHFLKIIKTIERISE